LFAGCPDCCIADTMDGRHSRNSLLKNLWDGLSSPSDRLESRSHSARSDFFNGLVRFHGVARRGDDGPLIQKDRGIHDKWFIAT